MQIKKISLGVLQTNCYLVWDAAEGIIIDPADEAEFIAEKIQELKFSPKAIVATHGHFDHVLGAGELQMITQAPFFISQDDLFLLEKMNQSARHWLGQPINKPLPIEIKFLKENNIVSFGRRKFQVISKPGHTPGSISLLTQTNILFSGDTLFAGAVGRTDFSYSNKAKLDVSLKQLFQLPKDTIVYPGHGDATTIGQETKT